MPRYLTSHSLACLTRQGAEELVKILWRPGPVTPVRVTVNMTEGKMFAEFEAADREAAEKWLRELGFHRDWLVRLELESTGDALRAL